MRVALTNAQQAAAVMRDLWPRVKAHLMNGGRLVLRVEREKKTRPQENKYHAQIDAIAKQCEHAGQRFDAEDWKRLLLQAFYTDTRHDPELAPMWREVGGYRMAPELDGAGFVMLGAQTRKFPAALASAFVDWLHAWGHAHNVTFTEDTQ